MMKILNYIKKIGLVGLALTSLVACGGSGSGSGGLDIETVGTYNLHINSLRLSPDTRDCKIELGVDPNVNLNQIDFSDPNNSFFITTQETLDPEVYTLTDASLDDFFIFGNVFGVNVEINANGPISCSSQNIPSLSCQGNVFENRASVTISYTINNCGITIGAAGNRI